MANHSTADTADDPRLDAICAAYFEARDAGWAVAPEVFLRCYPDDEVYLRPILANDAFFRPSPMSAPPSPVSPTTTGLPELGKGGMGVVYRLPDSPLGRDLALKVLQLEHAHKPDWIARFEREARLTGKLTLPGVPAVHTTGRTLDGRPFYTMQLIQGRTLQDVRGAGPLPPDQFPRMLRLFERIARTMAAVHQQGIIHRDLKPSNIMVRAEDVQVVDWGLAKEIGTPEIPVTVATGAGLVSAIRTKVGQGIGTLAYAPPEQLKGDWDRVGPASDVFALGGILCFLLTGEPPYRGTFADVQVQAKAGELAATHERLQQCGHEAPLVACAIACLQADPTQRPTDAGAVVALLEAYHAANATRLEQAKVAQAKARLRVQALSVGVLLLLALVGVGTFSWVQARDQRLREEQARNVLLTAFTDAAEWRKAGRYGDAHAAAQRAADLLPQANWPELEPDVQGVLRATRFAVTVMQIRQQRESVLEPEQGQGNAMAAAQYAQAFAGLALDPLAGDVKARVAAFQDTKLPGELLGMAVFDYARCLPEGADANALKMLGVQLEPKALEVMRLVLPVVQRDKVTPAEVETLVQQLIRKRYSPYLVAEVVQILLNRNYFDAARSLLQGYVQVYPNDFWLNLWYGWLHFYAPLPNDAEALRGFNAAAALRPTSAVPQRLIGLALLRLKRHPEAARYLRQALTLNPNDTEAQEALKKLP